MLRLLQILIYGHIHEWEETERFTLTNNKTPIGITIMARCVKCGLPKRFDLRE
jgi:hypothetical protein